MKTYKESEALLEGASSFAGKVWSKTEGLERDIHGDPLIQKYATMNELVTVTAGIKRTIDSTGGATVNYSGNAIKNQHNHH